MTRKNTNSVVPVPADINNANTTDRLFTSYINSDIAAEQASYSLREAICTIVINNTAVKTRVDNEFYNELIQEAEAFCCKKTINLYKDDKYVRTYTFIGNEQQILVEIERFFTDVIICYHCYYEDKISYEDKEGFCWECNGMKIAIV